MTYNNKGIEEFMNKLEGEDIKDSKDTKDSKDLKETKDSKPTKSISKTAKAMKLELEEGLKDIDALDPIERSCGLIALRKQMGLGVNAFEKLVENIVRMTEDKPPRKFSELKSYRKKKAPPVIPDLLGVGLTLFAAEGYAGKSKFAYQIIEAVTKGSMLMNQFECKEAKTLIIQVDESYEDYEQKEYSMDLQFKDENFEIWWDFTPLEFPELKKYIVENNVKVIMMDSLVRIAGAEISPKDAEFGILIYRLNQLAGELGLAIICIHHLNKKSNRETVKKEDIFGTAFIFNGAANCWGFWLEQASGELLANLKCLKSRNNVLPINEQYRFRECPDTERHIYMDRATGTATLNELNTNKNRVKNLLKDRPNSTFTPRDINQLLNLGNENYARNILKGLFDDRIGVNRIPDKNKIGPPTFYYQWVGG